MVYPSVRRASGTCPATSRPALVMNVRKGTTYRFRWSGHPTPTIAAVIPGRPLRKNPDLKLHYTFERWSTDDWTSAGHGIHAVEMARHNAGKTREPQAPSRPIDIFLVKAFSKKAKLIIAAQHFDDILAGLVNSEARRVR